MSNAEITYRGPSIDDPEMLAHLPQDLQAILRQENGFVWFSGGFHVRGACLAPSWHSLRHIWQGEHSLYSLYPDILLPTDIPFAQDCFGVQFLLRNGVILCFDGETGEMTEFTDTLNGFLQAAWKDPVTFLNIGWLVRFLNEGNTMQPGELLNVYPPFCTVWEGNPSLRAVPADEQIRFAASLYAQLASPPSGTAVSFKVE